MRIFCLMSITFVFLAFGLVKGAVGQIPENAWMYVNDLVNQQAKLWPGAQEPWTLAGLVEKESCITLTHSRCWNPNVELKTSREYGFGLGQITVAYREDGSERFNKFSELQQKFTELRGWSWERRFDPNYQLKALTLMVRNLYKRVKVFDTELDHWAFTLSSYNGGLSSLLRDQTYCKNLNGCDHEKWYGNVETHSLKSRKPQPSYGNRSWYSINRNYVYSVLKEKREKYKMFWVCACQ